MKANLLLQELVTRIPMISIAFGKPSKRYLPDSSGKYSKSITKGKPSKVNSVLTRMSKFGRKADNVAHGLREQVRLGGLKISDTVKGKLNSGPRILQVGGVKKIFMQLFGVREREKLLKASQCYLSTTSGPIAGLLFISTDKIAFCSDRSIKISSPQEEFSRIHYKVVIPIEKISCVNQSQNVETPSQKYIEIVTEDNFDVWFTGFLNYQKDFKYLQQAMFSHA